MCRRCGNSQDFNNYPFLTYIYITYIIVTEMINLLWSDGDTADNICAFVLLY